MILALVILAHWQPQYANEPADVRDWYEKAELTPDAEKRLHFKMCCAHADVVKTQFRVSQIDGSDQWQWLNNGQWQTVPADIIEPDHAPGGEPTLFVVGTTEVCFFPGDGGI